MCSSEMPSSSSVCSNCLTDTGRGILTRGKKQRGKAHSKKLIIIIIIIMMMMMMMMM